MAGNPRREGVPVGEDVVHEERPDDDPEGERHRAREKPWQIGGGTPGRRGEEHGRLLPQRPSAVADPPGHEPCLDGVEAGRQRRRDLPRLPGDADDDEPDRDRDDAREEDDDEEAAERPGYASAGQPVDDRREERAPSTTATTSGTASPDTWRRTERRTRIPIATPVSSHPRIPQVCRREPGSPRRTMVTGTSQLSHR